MRRGPWIRSLQSGVEKGDTITYNFKMEPSLILAHPNVKLTMEWLLFNVAHW